MNIEKGTIVIARKVQLFNGLYGQPRYGEILGVVTNVEDNKVKVVFPRNVSDKMQQWFEIDDVIPIIIIEDYCPEKTSTEELAAKLQFKLGEALINLGKQISETESALRSIKKELRQKDIPGMNINDLFALLLVKGGKEEVVWIITNIGQWLLDRKKALSEIPRIPQICKF